MRVSKNKDRIDKLLALGIRDLSMSLGALAHIEDNNYELVAVDSSTGAYAPGEVYALGNTFCRKVFEQQKVIAEINIENTPLTLNHPLYRALPLECYIGAPVMVGDEPWGCVDFSSVDQRDQAFGKKDIELVTWIAAEISGLLAAKE